jgi:ProP effector
MYQYPHKVERNEYVDYLAEMFPKCFFKHPDQRRPLKHNIVVDLEQRTTVDRTVLLHTIDWYQSHYRYRYGLIAGAVRIGLDGEKAGTVTPQEQAEARKWVRERKQEMAEQRRMAEQQKPPAIVVNGPANPPLNGAKMITAPTAPQGNTLSDEITIEKNIPMPARGPGRHSKFSAKFREMEVSDSFSIPKDGPGERQKHRWDARLRSWGSKQKPPRRFAARTQPDGGTRFWRVE